MSKQGVIVALTSIPSRFDTLADRLISILEQAPDHVVLTIPDAYYRFPDWDQTLPDLPSQVEVLRGPDMGPATKFLRPFRAFPDRDILICDDDCRYGDGWLAGFRDHRRAHPNAVVAGSTFDGARIGLPPYSCIAQGFAGIMLQPCWLGDFGDPEGAEMWVDDIWLSAQIAKAGRKIVDCPEALRAVNAFDAPDPLQSARPIGLSRADMNRQVAHTMWKKLGIRRDNGRALD